MKTAIAQCIALQGAAGSDGQVQFNTANALDANASFVFDSGSKQVLVGDEEPLVQASVGGVIATDLQTIGNTGGGEDDLIVYTLGAGKLVDAGDRIDFDVFGFFGVTSAGRVVKLYYGGAAFFTTPTLGAAFDSNKWRCFGSIIRTGGSAQLFVGNFTTGLSTTLGNTSAVIRNATINAIGAINNSLANIFKVTAESLGGTPVTNDVVQNGMLLSFYPAFYN